MGSAVTTLRGSRLAAVSVISFGLVACGQQSPGTNDRPPVLASPSDASARGPDPAATASSLPRSRGLARPSEPTEVDPVEYVFPVDPPASASYGRDHHDYPATDIFAECGTAFRSPVEGVVLEVVRRDTWDPSVDDPRTRGGLSVSLLGTDGVRYYGSHLQGIPPEVRAGVRLNPGDTLGAVGRSGNAQPTPCHLHFGISPPCDRTGDWSTRRGVVAPWAYLDAWRAGERVSPAHEVAEAVKRGACAEP